MSDSSDGRQPGGRRTAKLAAEKSRARTRRTTARAWSWQAYALWAALGVTVIVVTWLVVSVNVFLAPAGASVGVPRLVGLSLTSAQSVAAHAHLELHTIARRTDYRAPKDQILGQLPAAGEQVREGRSIDVIVSDGVPLVKAPNVASISLRDATVALENARLALGAVTSREQSDVTAGTVLDQHPDAFTELPAGSKVDVVVARGRPLRYTPDFIGYSESFAVAAAKEAGIALDKITMQALTPNAKPKGTIVTEDPSAGSPLLPNQRISLQVSGGAPPTPAPPSPLPTVDESSIGVSSPQPEASPSPTPALPLPESARAMRVSVALPASAAPARVRVVLLDANGSRTLYDQQTTGGFTLSFDVTVTGAATIETYVNDSLVNSTAL